MFMDEAILSDGGFSQETMGMKGLTSLWIS